MNARTLEPLRHTLMALERSLFNHHAAQSRARSSSNGIAVVGYNAHTDMAFELEVQFQRTHGTSHRTVGLFVASMKVSGFPAMYFVWGFLYLCCLLGLIVRFVTRSLIRFPARSIAHSLAHSIA